MGRVFKTQDFSYLMDQTRRSWILFQVADQKTSHICKGYGSFSRKCLYVDYK